jgi:hypothetical protein
MIKIILVFLMLTGCGYTTRLAVREEKIYIKPALNDISIAFEERAYSEYTSYPLLIEKRLTNTLISEFNIRGAFKVGSEDEASLRLECRIFDYKKESLRYSASDDITEQRLRLYTTIKLFDHDDQVVEEKTIVGDTTYFLTGSYAKSESAAIGDLIEDTARRIVEAVSEEW